MDDHDLLLRLEGKVDALTATVATFVSNSEKRDGDHEVRIRALEATKNQLFGRQSLIGGAIGVAAAVLTALLNAGKL